MDLMMPLQSGTDVARAMRGEPALRNVPIVALSASPWLVVNSDALFESVLTKPCGLNDLINAITRAVQP